MRRIARHPVFDVNCSARMYEFVVDGPGSDPVNRNHRQYVSCCNPTGRLGYPASELRLA